MTVDDICAALDVTSEELKGLLAAREVIYNLLYTAFIINPGEKLYDMLTALKDSLGTIADDSKEPLLTEGAALLLDFLKERSALSGGELEEYDLDSERQYTQILCLTNSVRTAESHYTSVEKLSRQDAYDECLKIYAEVSFPKPAHCEDADFISEEMRFMSFLSKKAAEALQTDDKEFERYMDASRRFMKQHLKNGNWLEMFLEEVSRYDTAKRLYKPFAKFMVGFVREDEEFLELF